MIARKAEEGTWDRERRKNSRRGRKEEQGIEPRMEEVKKVRIKKDMIKRSS